MEISETIDTLSALAHETRLKVYRLLETVGDGGMRSGDIAIKISVPPTSLSGHLNVLARAGIVDSERRGSAIIYRAKPERVKALARLLVDG